MNEPKEAFQKQLRAHLQKQSQPQQQQNKQTQSPLQQQQNNLFTNPYNQHKHKSNIPGYQSSYSSTPNIGEKLEAAKWRKHDNGYWYHKETQQTMCDTPSAILRVSAQNVVDWKKESQVYHKYNTLLTNISKQTSNECKEEEYNTKLIIKKSHIKLIHIYLVESFVNNNASFIPKGILDIILFYYAKPLIMRVKKDKEATIKFILYCPIIDTLHSMMDKIKNKFTIKSDFQLYYGDISTSSGIRMEDWIDLNWNTNDLFCVDTLFWKDWIMLPDPTSGRMYYANLKTRETRWDAPPEFSVQNVDQNPRYNPIFDGGFTTTNNTNPWQTRRYPPNPRAEFQNTNSHSSMNTMNSFDRLQASKWKKTIDSSTGREYWYHKETKQTRWDPPPVVLKMLSKNNASL